MLAPRSIRVVATPCRNAWKPANGIPNEVRSAEPQSSGNVFRLRCGPWNLGNKIGQQPRQQPRLLVPNSAQPERGKSRETLILKHFGFGCVYQRVAGSSPARFTTFLNKTKAICNHGAVFS